MISPSKSSCPRMLRKSVVLPTPFEPINPIFVLFSILNDTFSKSTLSPKLFETLLSVSRLINFLRNTQNTISQIYSSPFQ